MPDNKDILQIFKNKDDVVVKIFDYGAGEIVEIGNIKKYNPAQAPKKSYI